MGAEGSVVRRQVSRIARLEGLRHASVEKLPAWSEELAVGNFPDAVMREVKASPCLAQHASLDELFETIRHVGSIEARRILQETILEFATDDGRCRDQPATTFAQSLEPPRDHLLDPLRQLPRALQRAGGGRHRVFLRSTKRLQGHEGIAAA